jgi:hypothetical protein
MTCHEFPKENERNERVLIANFCHVPSSRTREWLPQIAHFNIFVPAHKNANELAGFLPGGQKPGRTPAAVLWQM